MRDPIILSLVAGPAGALAAAVIVVGISFVAGTVSAGEFLYQLTLWWLRDWLGTVVTATLILAWFRGRCTVWTWPRVAEAIALMITLWAGAQLMFGLWGASRTATCPSGSCSSRLSAGPGSASAPGVSPPRRGADLGFALVIAGMGVGPFATFPVAFTQFLFVRLPEPGVAQRPAARRHHGGA